MSIAKRTGWSILLAAALMASINMASGIGRDAVAATATEPALAIPGTIHRGNGKALHAPNGAGMPATVAAFLAAKGMGAATVASLRVKRQMDVDRSGSTVVDFVQEVQGLSVYGVRVRAIFDRDGALIKLSENLVSAGSVTPAMIQPRAALDAALSEVHPGRGADLTERGRSDKSVSYGGDEFFYQDPKVTRVAIPMPGGGLEEGFLVETWSEESNQLDHTIVSGDGQVLQVQHRTANDSYKVFTEHPDNTPDQTIVDGPGAGNEESPSGWLSGSQTTLDISGNNVHAYLDWINDGLPDGGGIAVTSGDFLTNACFPYVQPTDSGTSCPVDGYAYDNQAVAVQNLFYLNNIIHDRLYRHGFTEEAFNFQEDNFGASGDASDSVNAEAQDGGGINNANFATPVDGQNPRMQMYLWSFPNENGFLVGYLVTVNSESYPAQGAEFGPTLNGINPPLSGTVVAALDGVGTTSDGCETLTNGAALLGKIALIDRGDCFFSIKVRNAQDAGAIAAIIVNNQGDALLTMSVSPEDPAGDITIPSVFIGQSDGDVIKTSLITPPVIATLNINPWNDGDLDSDIVWHEYGHGLTWRMIGNMTGIMGGAIGEGMSDALSIIMSDDDRVGEYSTGDPIGIRSAPYDTYLEDTGRTYESFVIQVHADGEIYAAAIWDLWRRYRDEPGFSIPEARDALLDDLIAGMAQTVYQCGRPTFPTMRNAILEAIGGTSDPNGVIANGDHGQWCHAWQAFARYGVGVSETTSCTVSGSMILWEWFEAFDVPSQCATGDWPIVSISVSPSNVLEGAQVTFTGSATDTEDGVLTAGLSWRSDLDGPIGSGGSFQTTSLSVGTHTVTARVTDSAGNSGSDSVTITVEGVLTPNTAPVATDKSVVTTRNSAVSIDLTGSGSDVDGDPLTFQIMAGPTNGALTGAPPSVTYTPNKGYVGSASFTFVVNDGIEDSNVATVSIDVVKPGKGGSGGPTPPTASFSYSCTLLAPFTCNFSDTSTDDDGTIASWKWIGDDGISSTEPILVHEYSEEGTYSVSLTVTDNDGLSDTTTQNVTPGGAMTLTATGYKIKGVQHVDLTWNGATRDVGIYRDGDLIATTGKTGPYTDNIGKKGGGSYVYQVCETGSAPAVCSDTVTVTF